MKPKPNCKNNVTFFLRSAVVLASLMLGNDLFAKEPIELPLSSNTSNLKVLKAYRGMPDEKGTLETYILKTPEFEKAIYYRGLWWPYGGNRVGGKGITSPDQAKEGGMFVLLKLKNGSYLAILPLSGDKAYSYLSPHEGEFQLKLATFGKTKISGDQPLVSWATADSPYGACAQAWAKASETPQIKGNMKLREQKTYPEVFKYLGWCSWEAYHGNISSDKMVHEMKGLAKSELPVRYVLIDDGHFSKQTLMARTDKFPNGYKDLTDLKSEDGIKWVGMWHALLGNGTGMGSPCPPGLEDHMMEANNGRWVAKPNAESIEVFMHYLVSQSVKDGIDFVKVDFSGPLLPYYAGSSDHNMSASLPETTADAIGNPAEATALYSRVYQKVIAERFQGLINCNWQTPQFIFNSGESSVGRCSADYKVGKLNVAKSHLHASYNKIPWLGQICWGDHDMFHSSDEFAGRMMAISKAMSGGPVYLSDKCEELVAEHVIPLCYQDGLLLRPLAPAAPVSEDLFMNVRDKGLYRAMAPLANKTAAFAVYNFHGDKEQDLVELSSRITEANYCSAAEMMQPYTGKWEMPKEGLVVYDHTTQKASKMNQQYEFTLKGFSDRLIQVSPIHSGWSVIGRTDKYLSAAAVKIISVQPNQITLTLHEAGPFGLWLAKGKPVAKGVQFTDKGNGFFVAELPVKAEPMKLLIKRGK